MFAEHKDKVFLVVEQPVIAREGWKLKLDEVLGRETPLVLGGVKPYCWIRVRFVDSLESHNFGPETINWIENKIAQILEIILISSEFLNSTRFDNSLI